MRKICFLYVFLIVLSSCSTIINNPYQKIHIDHDPGISVRIDSSRYSYRGNEPYNVFRPKNYVQKDFYFLRCKNEIPLIVNETDTFNLKPHRSYFSFWFGKIDQDLFPRTTVEVAYADSLGNIIRADSCAINRLIKTINNDWALTEFRFKMKSEEKKLLVTIWNNDLKNKDTLFIDEILIRPFYTNIYKINKEKSIIKNNREYIKE